MNRVSVGTAADKGTLEPAPFGDEHWGTFWKVPAAGEGEQEERSEEYPLEESAGGEIHNGNAL